MKKLSRSIVALALCCAVLASCGSGSPNTPNKRKDPVTPAPPPGQKQCPGLNPSNAHIVTLNMLSALPPKLGLKLEGDPDFRLSDCADKTQTGVQASWSRTSMQLKILVEHGTALNNRLPLSQSLEIFNMGNDCRQSPPLSIYKSATPLPIAWRTETPVPGCPQTRAIGEATNN